MICDRTAIKFVLEIKFPLSHTANLLCIASDSVNNCGGAGSRVYCVLFQRLSWLLFSKLIYPLWKEKGLSLAAFWGGILCAWATCFWRWSIPVSFVSLNRAQFQSSLSVVMAVLHCGLARSALKQSCCGWTPTDRFSCQQVACGGLASSFCL